MYMVILQNKGEEKAQVNRYDYEDHQNIYITGVVRYRTSFSP